MNPFAPRLTPAGVLALVLFLLLFVLLFAVPARSQTNGTRVTPCDPATPNNALCFDITTIPTTREDGKPITGALSYAVEYRLGSATTWTSAGATFTGKNLYVKDLAPGLYTFRGYAIEAGLQSKAGAEVGGESKAVPPAPPNPPVYRVVQVEISLNAAPVFRASTREFIGLVPVGRDCSGPVLFKKRGYSFRSVVMKPSEAWQDAGPAPRTAAAPCVRVAG